MLCQRTSTSFLANTATFKEKGLKFDERMDQLLFEDFFLDAKTKGAVVATRPEVYFAVRSAQKDRASAVQHVTTKFVADLIPFGLKHQVMTVRDIENTVLQVCERYSTLGTIFEDNTTSPTAGGKPLFKDEELLCDYDKARLHWNSRHWAYGGMFAPPTMMIALKRSLMLAGNFFDTKGWAWALSAGGNLCFIFREKLFLKMVARAGFRDRFYLLTAFSHISLLLCLTILAIFRVRQRCGRCDRHPHATQLVARSFQFNQKI